MLDREREAALPVGLDECCPAEFGKGAKRPKLSDRAGATLDRLHGCGIIEPGLHQVAGIAREARNAWTHELAPVEEAAADACLRAARRLMELVYRADFSLPGYRIYSSGMS